MYYNSGESCNIFYMGNKCGYGFEIYYMNMILKCFKCIINMNKVFV